MLMLIIVYLTYLLYSSCVKSGVSLHHRCNNIATLVVFFLALYLIVTPFIPNATYYVSAAIQPPESATKAMENISDTPVLAIPKLKLTETILESNDASILNQGIWRRPNASQPDKGGNTVIVGHRFVKNSPGVFYHLDKLNPGDTLSVDWDSARYQYEITRVFVVPPTAVNIEAETTEPLLTLYTCTPLWSSAQRLVIQAKLVSTTP